MIKYQSGNETIIQPINGRDSRGVSVALNIGIGIAIGVAAACFLILPAKLNSDTSEVQDELRAVSEQLDKKTSTIEEMEQQARVLTEENERLRQELSSYSSDDGSLPIIDSLLQAVDIYMENSENIEGVAKVLEGMDKNAAEQIESENFQSLYKTLLAQAGPSIASSYYEAGMDSYQKEMYGDAVEALAKAAEYDPENGDILYDLGNAYRQNGNDDRAIEIYLSVIEKYPNTEKARRSQGFLDDMTEG